MRDENLLNFLRLKSFFDLTNGLKEIEQIKMYSLDSKSLYSAFPYGRKIYVGYSSSFLRPQEFSIVTYDLNSRKEEFFLTMRERENKPYGFDFLFDAIFPLSTGEISFVTDQGRGTINCRRNEVCVVR